MKKQLYEILGFISSESYMGIKLDIAAHLVVGTFLYLLFRRYLSQNSSLICTLIMALIKEIHDTGIMTNTISENVKDIVVTMLIPILIIKYKEAYSNSGTSPI